MLPIEEGEYKVKQQGKYNEYRAIKFKKFKFKKHLVAKLNQLKTASKYIESE